MLEKNVLITGASSGIGKAFSLDVASRGYNVILVARSEDALNELANKIRTSYNVKAWVIPCDLSEQHASTILYNQTQNSNVNVDILINNAGFGQWGPFQKTDLTKYTSMVNVNIQSLTELSYLYLPHMLKSNSGGIINVASIVALMPIPYSAIYSATKSYVLHFSEALSEELSNTNVTISCLCPSSTKTNFSNIAAQHVELNEKHIEKAEYVAKIGVNGFLKGRPYILTGNKKRFISLLPRILSRKQMVKLAGNVFKKRGIHHTTS